ncbi:MAG: lysylphosphatidylglycerol synthase transmembrane domain-containing protein [Bacillota bacterium]
MISRNSISRRTIQRGITVTVGLSFLCLLAVNLYSSGGDTLKVLRALNTFKLCWAAAAGLLMLALSWLVEGMRIKVISTLLEENLPLYKIILINLATFFTGNMTPYTSGGAPTQVYLLHKEGMSLGKASAVVTARIATGTLVFTLGAPVLLFIFPKVLHLALFIQIILIILGAVISGLLIFFLSRPHAAKNLLLTFLALFKCSKEKQKCSSAECDASDRGKNIFLETNLEAFFKALDEFHLCLTALFHKNKGLIALILILSSLFWLSFFSIAPVILYFLGFKVNFASSILLQYLFIFVAAYLPIPGGSGVVELGFLSIFRQLYVPKNMLGVIITLWRLISFHTNNIVGGVIFLRLLKDKSPAATRE